MQKKKLARNYKNKKTQTMRDIKLTAAAAADDHLIRLADRRVAIFAVNEQRRASNAAAADLRAARAIQKTRRRRLPPLHCA